MYENILTKKYQMYMTLKKYPKKCILFRIDGRVVVCVCVFFNYYTQ